MPRPLAKRTPTEALAPFLEGIVEATRGACSAYKLQLASYLAFGLDGIAQIPSLVQRIGPDHVKILDLKAGDIPNTMTLYAQGTFDRWGFDAITVSPYLGWDSVDAVLGNPVRGVFILAHTSNPGSKDLQEQRMADGRPLWEGLLPAIRERAERSGNVGAVVGATFPEAMGRAREALGPGVPILAPAVGSQGGDLEATLRLGRGQGAGALLVNSSRGILFASAGDDWKEAAAKEARRLGAAMPTVGARAPVAP